MNSSTSAGEIPYAARSVEVVLLVVDDCWTAVDVKMAAWELGGEAFDGRGVLGVGVAESLTEVPADALSCLTADWLLVEL